MKRRHPIAQSTAAILLLLCAAVGAAQPATGLEAQRAAFREVLPEAELGNWQPAREREPLLADYALWPDLQAAFLRTTMGAGNDAEIRAFLDRYGTLKPARELRYRYALRLADDGRYDDFLEIYRPYYADLGVARLDCIALQAAIAQGRQERLAARGHELWLVGSSQTDECEPVFDHMRDTGLLGSALYRQRFDLAIEARQFSLARYLSSALPPEYRDQASRWLAAQDSPAEFLQHHEQRGDSDIQRRQLLFAMERMAFTDPVAAAGHLAALLMTYEFDRQQESDLRRHIALWSARLHLPQAAAYLQQLPAAAIDDEVRRWRVRNSLYRGDWAEVLQGLEQLPADERSAEQWQYWLAISLAELNRQTDAEILLRELAATRGYYGFLAADALGAKYAFSHRPMPADEAILAELAAARPLQRARELFLVGLEGRGRSEWDAAIAYMSAERKIQAAVLAHRWGWHSRAIATAAAVGEFDDLRIRYPLPYVDSFRQFSADAQIQPSWAYGIARSESLFMRDIRSSAGAIGVMQLLPETGRRTARAIDYPFAGRVTLTDPESNIRLGTRYLGQMVEHFDGHLALATAAYNAGPLRVRDWLPESGDQDARIWIENIPYNETRKYVRRVLATGAIFRWRMTGKVRRVSRDLPAVLAPTESGQAAMID